MSTLTMRDGTQLFYKDWGAGQPMVFSHGWPLSADAWDAQMLFFGERGYRVIAHDRRSHGRSSQTWGGNDMDTYADDLAALFDTLDLKHAILVGHSTGGGEVTRYLGRHGTARVDKLVLLGAVPPCLLKSKSNPDGVPMEAFDVLRTGIRRDRSQFFRDMAQSFYGYNRAGSKPSQGIIDSFWRQSVKAGIKGVFDCIKAFSESDFTADLQKIDIPTLIAHGDDDQIVPINLSALKTVKILKSATLRVYKGAPHGLATTRHEEFNTDLLAFVESGAQYVAASGAPPTTH
ncbi:MAG: alpha/beta fold hydrolase [Polyangia bacterium]